MGGREAADTTPSPPQGRQLRPFASFSKQPVRAHNGVGFLIYKTSLGALTEVLYENTKEHKS